MVDTADGTLRELLRRRASVDRFDSGRDLDEGEIRRLIEAATLAPSSFNIQHWRFVAVRRPEDKARLRRAAYGQRQVGEAAVTFVILGDLRGVERLPEILEVAVERGTLPAGKAAAWVRMAGQIYGDSALARDEAIRSASLAAMALMLAATERGLGSCALSGFDPQAVCREFEISKRYLPVMLLCVGPALEGESRQQPRLAIEEVLGFDRSGFP